MPPHPVPTISTVNSGKYHTGTGNMRAAAILEMVNRSQDDPDIPWRTYCIDKKIEKYSAVFWRIGPLKQEKVNFHISQIIRLLQFWTSLSHKCLERPSPLAELRDADKLENVDPQEYCLCIVNVMITEKKHIGQITMDIGIHVNEINSFNWPHPQWGFSRPM